MLSFKEALGNLKSSDEFKNWKKGNPKAHLCYGFLILEDKDDNWKIGYYHKQNDKMTSFIISDNKIAIEPGEEVFKKETAKVKPLNEEKVKIDLADAVAIANDLQKEEYATENPQKIIAILQNLDVGQVWNITFFTQSFNTLNFKIKCDTGRVLNKKLASLFEVK